MPIPALPLNTSATGPCNWPISVECCSTWADYDPALQLRATEWATLVLWAATGRRYGTCEVTVRPCGRYGSSTDTGLWTLDSDGGSWAPYILDGEWFNGCGCGESPCCCEATCRVRLPGPVAEVTEVLVDGVAVDEDTYRVDNRQWLVRTGTGNCWPSCSNMDATEGAGLFQVTYLYGKDVPATAMAAAGTLACEFAKACTGGTCRLPARVTQIVRSGITVSMVDVDQMLDKGLTGITEVDMAIRALNPYSLKARPRLYSPDIDYPVTTTSP
jgi:hypothetical protein